MSQLAFVACGAAVGLVPESTAAAGHASVCFLSIEGDTNIVTSAIAWNEKNQNSAVGEFVDMACNKTEAINSNGNRLGV